LFAAGISRFASMLDGFMYDFIQDSRFKNIVLEDLRSGNHRNPTDRPEWFTDAYFHLPDELKKEVCEAGFKKVTLLGIEGFGLRLPNFDTYWENKELRALLLSFLEKIEQESSLLGISSHFMAIGRK
jgi:hypothetical protein